MVQFEVTILGNNSAFPAHGRFPSAQVLHYDGRMFLIDCGEGTQMRLDEYDIRRSRIDHIFISHLHGDHIFGLPGLINSYTQFNRTAPLHIYGPKGIRQLIDTVLRLSGSMVNYDLQFHELDQRERMKVYEGRGLRAYAFPLRHRIPTYGYLFIEREQPLNIRKEAIHEHDLSIPQIKDVKAGKAIDIEGETVAAEELAKPPDPLRSYAYCSDTAFDEEVAEAVKGVTLLYHEATFLHELEQKAKVSMHTTAFQAGMLARLAEAGQLLIGHFSSRYTDLEPFIEEAREAFPDVAIAREGQTYVVHIRD